MPKFNVWNMTNEVDVFGANGIFVTFAKNQHGFVTDIINTNLDRGCKLIEEMRQRANDRIEYENERLATR